METNVLRGMIVEQYKTIGAFADAVGWKRNKASRILNGVQEMDISEIQDVTAALGIESVEEFMRLFFPRLSTKWTM